MPADWPEQFPPKTSHVVEAALVATLVIRKYVRGRPQGPPLLPRKDLL